MIDLLVFNLAGQQYGLPARRVAEVVPRASLTLLPGAPKGLIGMLRLRGALVPVIDLRTRLGLPAAIPRIGQCIIVTRSDPADIGFLVDGVDGLVACAEIRLEATPSSGAGQFVQQVREAAGGVVTILDAEAAIGKKVRTYLAAIACGASSDGGNGTPPREVTAA
jgi:purine-binding chemotaxis protein CheW